MVWGKAAVMHIDVYLIEPAGAVAARDAGISLLQARAPAGLRSQRMPGSRLGCLHEGWIFYLVSML